MKKTTFTLLTLLLFAAGCSNAINENGYTYDPWEPVNRKIFAFNNTLDSYLLKPVAEGYEKITPSPVKTGISNFFGNLSDMGSFANSVFQLEFKQSMQILVRVIDNTVYGFGGLVDVATPMGNPKINEDFGKTLAHYGLKSGPYIMLPFLGPSTVRDGIGRAIDAQTTAPLHYLKNDKIFWSMAGVNAVQSRSKLLPLEKTFKSENDKYALIRDAWLQNRFSQINGTLRSKGVQNAIDDLFRQEAEEQKK